MAKLKRVEQQRENDCTIAVVASVMGPPFTYERVLRDNPGYAQDKSAWWETYLWKAGFPNRYYPVSCLHFAQREEIVGILTLVPIQGQTGHVVAIDELGVINPAMRWPERLRDVDDLLREYRRIKGFDVYVSESDFLAVWRN